MRVDRATLDLTATGRFVDPPTWPRSTWAGDVATYAAVLRAEGWAPDVAFDEALRTARAPSRSRS